MTSNFPTETNRNQRTALDSDDDNGQDCPNKPETQNLAGKNTPTHTEDNKNKEARPHENQHDKTAPVTTGLSCLDSKNVSQNIQLLLSVWSFCGVVRLEAGELLQLLPSVWAGGRELLPPFTSCQSLQ